MKKTATHGTLIKEQKECSQTKRQNFPHTQEYITLIIGHLQNIRNRFLRTRNFLFGYNLSNFV